MRKWIFIAVGILFAGFIAFRAVNNYRAQRAARNGQVQEKIIPVTVASPAPEEISETIRAAGNIFANAEVTLYSKVSGKIREIRVRMGSSVRPGQPVCLVIRDEVGYDFQPYEVKSEVKGEISRILQNPGAAVNPSLPLMTLVDIDTVKAVASVDELKIRFIRIGQAARIFVQAFPGEKFFGKVAAVSPVCNPSNRTVDVEVRISNRSLRLKPGMYAEAEFTREKRKIMTLPVSAVVETASGKVVFIPRGGRAAMAPVTTGLMIGDRIEIAAGLTGGESVVAAGASLLEDGCRVVVTADSAR
jgi:multidrug efflux pump subunit AcrA (membrane-fusion protein)